MTSRGSLSSKKCVRFNAAALLIGPALAGCISTADLRKPSHSEWPLYGGDWGNTRFSPLGAINTTNVSELGGAWVFKLKDENTTATPVMQNGVMYVIAGSHLYALDARTGVIHWSYKSTVALAPRAVALGEGLVFAGTRDAHVVALNIKDGTKVWSTMIGEEPAFFGQMISGAPGYIDGLVITGVANGDFGVRGRIVALNAKSGVQAWRFDTVPGPDEFGHDTWPRGSDVWRKGGAGVWMAPAFDPDLGLVYLGTGNAVPQWGGAPRAGDNLFTCSVVALDYKTGKLRWYYQLVHHDLWDHDLGTPLVLYDATVRGERRKALAAMRTDGYLFMLDRRTGKPLFPVEERAVPQDTWEKSAATQPFPVGADGFGPRCVQDGMVPASFVPLCYFDVIDERPNLMALVMTTRSAPMSYDPETGYFYVTGSVAPFWVRHTRKDPWLFYYTGVVPGMKQYGLIAAIDSRTDKIVWQNKLPYKVQNGSGVLTTGGGLAFHGHPDGRFLAFDARSGAQLWEYQLGSAVNGPATSYRLDGEQYIAVTAQDAIWAFKMGGSIAPAPAAPAVPTVTGFVGVIEDTGEVALGSTFSDLGLMGQRVEVDPYGLEPQRIRIRAGTAVTFTNKTLMPHHPKALDGTWDAGEIEPGESKSVQMPRRGVTVYVCADHPWTYGEITVE
jgi:quinohemoprotein ethanol dehydrogenase